MARAPSSSGKKALKKKTSKASPATTTTTTAAPASAPLTPSNKRLRRTEEAATPEAGEDGATHRLIEAYNHLLHVRMTEPETRLSDMDKKWRETQASAKALESTVAQVRAALEKRLTGDADLAAKCDKLRKENEELRSELKETAAQGLLASKERDALYKTLNDCVSKEDNRRVVDLLEVYKTLTGMLVLPNEEEDEGSYRVEARNLSASSTPSETSSTRFQVTFKAGNVLFTTSAAQLPKSVPRPLRKTGQVTALKREAPKIVVDALAALFGDQRQQQ